MLNIHDLNVAYGRCGMLVVPDNITLLYLPPYSPEFNPKENIGTRFAKNSSKTMRSNPSPRCSLNPGRQSSTTSVIPSSFARSPHSLYRQLTLM